MEPDKLALLTILTGAATYAARKLAPRIWSDIPARWRWLVPILIAWAVAFGERLQAGAPPRDAALGSLWGVLAGLGASGGHHALVDSPLPYGESPPSSGSES